MGDTLLKSFAFVSLHKEVVRAILQVAFNFFQMLESALKRKSVKALNAKQMMLQLLWFLAETSWWGCRKGDSQAAVPCLSRLAWEKVTCRRCCCSTESGVLGGNCCQHQKHLSHCSQSLFQSPTQGPWERSLLSFSGEDTLQLKYLETNSTLRVHVSGGCCWSLHLRASREHSYPGTQSRT